MSEPEFGAEMTNASGNAAKRAILKIFVKRKNN